MTLEVIESQMEELFEKQRDECGPRMAAATRRLNILGKLRRQIMIEMRVDPTTIPDAF